MKEKRCGTLRSNIVRNLGGEHQDLADAQTVGSSVRHHCDLALDELNRDSSRDPVLVDARTGVEREQRDRAIAMLEQRPLPVAVQGWPLCSDCGRLCGKIEDHRQSSKPGFW
ncbi:MAG: hypothetical protein U0573_12205 [Phycisphaerales bacterium]